MACLSKITFITILVTWWKSDRVRIYSVTLWLWVSNVYTKLLQKKEQNSSRASGTLSNLIPLHAIASAIEEVSNLVHTTQISQLKKHLRRMNKNNVCSPQLRAGLGEAALKFGATTATRKYSTKLSMRINKSTVWGLKSVRFIGQWKICREEDALTVTSLPPKKQGRPSKSW